MSKFVTAVAISIFVLAIVAPLGFTQFFNVDTSGWDAQSILIWGAVPVVALLAIILFLLSKATGQLALMPFGAFAADGLTLNVPVWYVAGVVLTALVLTYAINARLSVRKQRKQDLAFLRSEWQASNALPDSIAA